MFLISERSLNYGAHLLPSLPVALGCQDSNLGMTAPKAVALPLGYTPISDFKTLIHWSVDISGSPYKRKSPIHKELG